MKKLIFLLVFSFFSINVTSCARNVSPDSYAVGSVGQANRAVKGVIISAREVEILGNQAGVGSAAGTAAGATAGSFIGGGTRGNIIGAIGGAVVGGIVGSVIEEGATRQKGMAYVIETDNGALITIVQGIENPFALKQRVTVLYGTRARIIPDQKQ